MEKMFRIMGWVLFVVLAMAVGVYAGHWLPIIF